MDEFDQLVAQICNSQSSVDVRSYAERRLLDILSDKSSWRVYSNLLPQANDTVCFFICIGLQRLVWKHWKEFTNEDKNQLNQIVVQSLSTKKNMQHFAKSKLEQMLATICANSCSLEPVLSLLVAADQPGALVGLSAMRSVLDLVLSDDPKLIPEHKATILTVVNEILTPMTNLACSACSFALQAPTEDNVKLMSVSLELLKTTIGKLQIGPHITRDVINLLFTLAELGADDSSVLHKGALSSIEVLTEIMSKRYIPPSQPLIVSPKSALHASSFVTRPGNDSSSDMLLDIVVKSVSLLKNYRSRSSIEDSPIVLSLLEFISVFAESHLERCINLTTGGASSSNALLTQSIGLFFEELVGITTVSMEPRILSKVVSVWNRVISLEAVKNMLLLGSSSVCLSIVSHLLQSCLTQTSAHLAESTDELIEDLRVDGVADPHMKEILAHLVASEGSTTAASSSGSSGSGSKGDEVLSAEESSFVGTALLHDVNVLFAELVSSSGVAQWLNQTTTQLLAQNIALLSNGSTQPAAKTCAALDICFIVRLLPMITTNKTELVLQLTDLAVRLMEARMHSYGKELLVLEISCCHIAGQILQSNYLQTAQGLTQELCATMTSLFTILLRGLAAVCDTYISPSPHSVIVAVCVLLNQAIVAFSDLLDAEAASNSSSSVKASVFQTLNGLLDKSKDLSVEAYALLICAHDHLDPNSVASSLVAQCMECIALLESNCNNNQPNNKAQIGAVIRVCGAMDSLSRHHSLSKAPRRQCLVAHFTPLQSVLGNFISVIFRQIIQSYSTQNSSSASSVGSSIQAATIVISLAGALLQSLGKKTFGRAASEVLSVCVDFAENVRNTPLTAGATNNLSNVLFEGSGLLLTKQFLELSRVLAESTGASSSTASSQAAVTHRLLAFVTTGLSDERVCAELLQPTLRAGVVAIGCYWQKAQKQQSALFAMQQQQHSLYASISSSTGDSGEASGTNVQPIAVLLTQLCVGSLGPTVPPQDTLTALEGLISLGEQHQLFAAAWFQSQSWGSLLTPCLRAVLLRIHNMHRDTIETLLVALAKAGLSSYLAVSPSDSPGSKGNQQARAQEFWLNIGREVVTVASEFHCGEVANQTVFNVVTSFANNGSSNAQGPGALDMRLFVDRVLNPVSAEIARLL